MAPIMFQGPPFFKVGGSLGPHFVILDPSLYIANTVVFISVTEICFSTIYENVQNLPFAYFLHASFELFSLEEDEKH